MSDLHAKPGREIDLDRPTAEITKLYVKLPQTRIVKTAQDAIVAEDSERPVKHWFEERRIASPYTSAEIIK